MNRHNQRVQHIIKQLSDKKKLGHFYLFRCSGDSNESLHQHTLEWSRDILQQIIPGIKKESFPQCPDLLLIGEESDVSKEDLSRVAEFARFRPLELPWRFVVIYEAQNLTESMQNKLLKTLESPPEQTSFFFFYRDKGTILPTILGRSILFDLRFQTVVLKENQLEKILGQLSTEEKEVFNNYLAKKIALYELLEFFKKRKTKEKILHYFIEKERWKYHSFEDKERFLRLMETITRNGPFHNCIWGQIGIIALSSE